MARIKVIQENEAQGELHDIYESLIESRGKLAEVHKIQSLNPKTILSHMNLYMDIMYGQSPLKRAQREMIAVVVSVANQCEYCTRHHAEALQAYWKDDAKIEKLITEMTTFEIEGMDKLWIVYAEELTLRPSSKKTETLISQLKASGADDRSILDATLVIAYFNFVNRIILGLGVSLEVDGGKGYKYQ